MYEPGPLEAITILNLTSIPVAVLGVYKACEQFLKDADIAKIDNIARGLKSKYDKDAMLTYSNMIRAVADGLPEDLDKLENKSLLCLAGIGFMAGSLSNIALLMRAIAISNEDRKDFPSNYKKIFDELEARLTALGESSKNSCKNQLILYSEQLEKLAEDMP